MGRTKLLGCGECPRFPEVLRGAYGTPAQALTHDVEGEPGRTAALTVHANNGMDFLTLAPAA